MNKKLLISAITITMVISSLVAAPQVFAQSTPNYNNLVQKIADKFGLNKTDVQSVFDQVHADRYAQMQTKIEAKLTQLVKTGKITDAQKTLILNKQKELASERPSKDSLKNLTPEERKAQMTAKKTALEAWAKQNGIDLKYLMPYKFGVKGGKFTK